MEEFFSTQSHYPTSTNLANKLGHHFAVAGLPCARAQGSPMGEPVDAL
jgi:hypothetical protein